MMLEVIMAVIILIPIILLVFFQRRKTPGIPFSELLYQVMGRFLLVFGILMLFPAFYQLFHGKSGSMKAVLLTVSLVMVFGGYIMTNRSGGKPKSE
jgi:hypothetical protein